MRRFLALGLVVAIAACSPSQQPAPTTTVAATTTTPAAPTTSQSQDTTTTTVSHTTLSEFRGLAYERVSSLDFPIQLVARPGASDGYVILKSGRVLYFDGTSVLEDPVVDISGRVRDAGEQGLLAMALHPQDDTRAFLHYSARPDGDTVVAEYRITDPATIDPDSERVLLRLDQPAGNHNGGMIQFGPDGVLYVGLGDGGGANDQFGHGQNPDTLLGGLVALAVDGDPNPTLFFMGLRNPWRFWIDGDTVYIADVGQNRFEEVSVTSLQPGLNFGWPVLEGLHCFRPPAGCEDTGFVRPVVEVARSDSGTCSITGGVVYRGQGIPELFGHYFYSDYCGGYLRSFRFEDGAASEETDWTGQVGVASQVVGFGVDGFGEMYVATTDALYRIVAIRG